MRYIFLLAIFLSGCNSPEIGKKESEINQFIGEWKVVRYNKGDLGVSAGKLGEIHISMDAISSNLDNKTYIYQIFENTKFHLVDKVSKETRKGLFAFQSNEKLVCKLAQVGNDFPDDLTEAEINDGSLFLILER